MESFRFFDVRLSAFADPEGAVAEVKAEGLIKPTRRIYRQDYILFLRAAGGKIVFLRESFDPMRAARRWTRRFLRTFLPTLANRGKMARLHT